MLALIDDHKAELAALCREHGVAKLEVFGSACTEEFDSERSDIDFLAEYPPGYDFGPWAGRLQEFEEALSTLFGRKVDVVLVSSLRNRWFRREADKTRQVVFDMGVPRVGAVSRPGERPFGVASG